MHLVCLYTFEVDAQVHWVVYAKKTPDALLHRLVFTRKNGNVLFILMVLS